MWPVGIEPTIYSTFAPFLLRGEGVLPNNPMQGLTRSLPLHCPRYSLRYHFCHGRIVPQLRLTFRSLDVDDHSLDRHWLVADVDFTSRAVMLMIDAPGVKPI